MDGLTAHYLARELHERWRGRRVLGSALDRDPLGVTLHVVGSAPVRLDLSTADAVAREQTDAPAPGPLGGWTVAGCDAPTDDRRIVILLERPGKFRNSPARAATLEISVVPTARGVLLRDQGGQKLAALGAALPKRSEPRPVLADEEITRAVRDGDRGALLRGRWMHPRLADHLLSLGDAAPARYRELCALPAPSPARCDGRPVPFAWRESAAPLASLVETAGAGDALAEPAPASPRERALARMRRELERAADAPRLREVADQLMSMGDGVPAPAEVTLPGGATARVDSSPGDTPVTVAERLYREVRSMERAAATLPARIAETEAAVASDVREAARGDGPTADARPEQPTGLPYRSYRSSGGLEIRVGRGSRWNDRLTFGESAPDEVWLHARDSAGAHVVLRWAHDDAPPARDLEEAALLAAWHSKSRGSTVVPVDWTRRKYVRKPRGAPPGSVAVLRAETIFVRPDPSVERKLRDRAT